MIFYVYFDPAVIDIANTNGDFAKQSLIAILRGFSQNCLLMDFLDYRLQDAIKDKMVALDNNFDKKIIKSIFAHIAKQNRFIYCLQDHKGTQEDILLMINQAAAELIDMALLGAPYAGERPKGLQIATLSNYQGSQFEIDRSRLAANGRTIPPNVQTQADFLNENFLKVFRHAAKIEICDKLFGSRFSDNYVYSAGELLTWMKDVMADPSRQQLTFLCAKPPDNLDKHLEGTLSGYKKKHLSAMPMQVQYYNADGLPDNMPHDRFILTNQIALSIGRGMDFLDKKTKKARDISLNIIDKDECSKVLNAYTTAIINPIVSL